MWCSINAMSVCESEKLMLSEAVNLFSDVLQGTFNCAVQFYSKCHLFFTIKTFTACIRPRL